jgi:hypothetical protein
MQTTGFRCVLSDVRSCDAAADEQPGEHDTERWLHQDLLVVGKGGAETAAAGA